MTSVAAVASTVSSSIAIAVMVASSSSSIAVASATVTLLWTAILELFVLLAYVAKKVLTKLSGFLDHLRIRTASEQLDLGFTGIGRFHLRDMQVHGLIAFLTRALLNEARTTSLDLHSAPGLALDVFDVRTAMSDDLRT